MTTRNTQLCPVHREPLVPGGRRVIIEGLRPIEGFFVALKQTYPLANALRIRACNGTVKGRATASYCPGCRKALADWARNNAEDERNGWLAKLLLNELFADSDA